MTCRGVWDVLIFVSLVCSFVHSQATGADPAKLQQELDQTQKQLAHVTNLLNESETNVERLVEQAKLLKDELRRQDRPEGPLNVEYLKQVVLQFLKHKHERQQLVPVLATLLQFSPEELHSIRGSVAKESAPPAAAADSRWASLFPRLG